MAEDFVDRSGTAPSSSTLDHWLSVAAEEIEDLTQENKRLTAQVKADRRLREQHTSLLAKSKAAREQAAAQASRATALEEELAQLNAKVFRNPHPGYPLEEDSCCWISDI